MYTKLTLMHLLDGLPDVLFPIPIAVHAFGCLYMEQSLSSLEKLYDINNNTVIAQLE